LSPRKGDPDRHQLVCDLYDLVGRMIGLAPEHEKDICEYGRRLNRAFLGPATPSERTKPGRASVGQSRVRDDLILIDIALDLAEQNATHGDLLADGLAGEIHDVLEQAWSEATPAGRLLWGKTSRGRNARVKAIRKKLVRLDQRLLEEFPEDGPDGDRKAKK
jgi:hypothetical protein